MVNNNKTYLGLTLFLIGFLRKTKNTGLSKQMGKIGLSKELKIIMNLNERDLRNRKIKYFLDKTNVGGGSCFAAPNLEDGSGTESVLSSEPERRRAN